jgi:hypothetical protein
VWYPERFGHGLSIGGIGLIGSRQPTWDCFDGGLLSLAPMQLNNIIYLAIILIFWCIWRHHNDVVFNGAWPDVVAIESRIRKEHSRWRLARLFRSDSFGFP